MTGQDGLHRLAVRELRTSPATSVAQWNGLVAEYDGTFFHRHEWLDATAHGLGMEFKPRIVLADGRPVGVAPLLVRRLGPFSTVNVLPFPYVGPLVPTSLLPPVLSMLAAKERRLRSVCAQQTVMSEAAPGLGKSGGYREIAERTLVVDLRGQTEESLLSRMRAQQRSAIRRAQRAGITLRKATELDVCHVLPAFTARTFAAQGLRMPNPPALYRTLWTRFGHEDDAHFTTAVVDGRPVCVAAAFAHRRYAVGWALARDIADERSSLGAASLYWDMIRWALHHGCTELDLVGAPTEGIAHYKRGLGAQERTYLVLRRDTKAYRAGIGMRAKRPNRRTRG